MSNELTTITEALTPQEKALLLNDLSKLTADQRSDLYIKVCKSVGLNPLTQPFAYLELNNKLTLYAQRNCTDQLRSINNVSLKIVSREKHGGLYVVTASASLPSGRIDESIAAVDLTESDRIKDYGKWIDNPRKGKELQGDQLANAIMKCETKAKRRVTLSICGLSFMDETEVDTVKGAKTIDVNQVHTPNKSLPATTEKPIVTKEEPDINNYLPDMNDIKKKLDDYTVPFGKKYFKKNLREVSLDELLSYVDFIEQSAKEKNAEIRGPVAEFISMVELYVEEKKYEEEIRESKERHSQQSGPGDFDYSEPMPTFDGQ